MAIAATLPDLPAKQDTTQSETAARSEEEAQRTRQLTAALLATSVVGTLAYGHAKWWPDGFTGHFHSANEAWFGRDTTVREQADPVEHDSPFLPALATLDRWRSRPNS